MMGRHVRATAILLAVFLGAVTILVSAQNWDGAPQLTSRAAPVAQENSSAAPADSITVPSGTRVPLIMKQDLTTKNARPGDPVYAQTSFPIVMKDRIAIPPGTFVQGEIRRVQRPGKVKGRAELQMSFTSMIFPNGYTLLLPGAVQGTPGNQNTAGVKDKEGTIQGEGSKGKDVGTVVGTAIPGAGIGAIAGGAKAAGIGALSGGALGLATVLFTRGPEINLAVGDSIEMVLERNITIDEAKVRRVDQ
jgi:type IV secretion system protein VirB10